MSNWTQPGQGFRRLDEQVEQVSEQQVMSYFDKLLEQDEEQLIEFLGKIKGAIAKHKEKKAFKKNASQLAKDHGSKVSHHVAHADAHDTAATHHDRGDPKKMNKGQAGHHSNAASDHDKAGQAHALAKKAAEKGDHKAYKMHSDAAKKHSEKAKGSHDKAVRKSEDGGHDGGDGDVYTIISLKNMVVLRNEILDFTRRRIL